MPLAQAAEGTCVRVARVQGDDRFRGKMIAMGIVPGVPLSVLKGGGKRPLLVAVDGGRFCLDRESSQKITVRDR